MTVTAMVSWLEGLLRGCPAGVRRGRRVEQLSRADRVARGKDARAVAPLESHAEFVAGPGAGSGRAAAGAGQVAGAGAGAGPARADAGVAVHLLPGRGAADGGRPGRHARLRAAGAAVRGRAPVQFRRVRLAGTATWSSTSTTSTRPCPARSSGTSSGSLVTHREVRPAQYARFMIDVFGEWVRAAIATVCVQMFDTALANWDREGGGMCVTVTCTPATTTSPDRP